LEALNGWWDDYLLASVTVAKVFICSLILMVIFGLLGASAKLSSNRLANALGNAYTVFFRGTPEILVILLLYFGSAISLTAIARYFEPSVNFVDIPPFWAGTIAIALVVGSYATETFRGAFKSVRRGSIEAARALGMNGLQTFFYIRLPEMWRTALPPLGNHMLSLIKDTALISIIGLNETLFVAKQAASTTGQPFTMYIVVGLIYLCFSSAITLAVMILETFANKHMQRRPS
jgi:polar amino acid transport system permease protein